MQKETIIVLSDHPLSPSGVGTQTKYYIEALLKTGRYKFVCLGGAIKHMDYNPIKTEEWGDDWVIYPVDGYGNADTIRSLMRTEKPCMLWFMTDPRFWGWLWEIEDEIRSQIPLVYYHVWDNYPYPDFNRPFYMSNDHVACISKLTYDIVQNVAPEVDSSYIPHAVDPEIFKKLPKEEIDKVRKQQLPQTENKTVFFWNNRNARRKQSGSLIFWFKDFLDRVGHDKACLIMHTDTKDMHGQDLERIIGHLGLTNGEVIFSTQKISPMHLSLVYNIADCTINVSDAEGFGLATLESLSCETPIIATMTGGLQEQVTDGEEWFGVGLEPASKAVIGSQDIPYIFEDRLRGDDVVDALEKIYNMSPEEREELGAKGRAHVDKNYSFEKYGQKWVDTIDGIVEKHGSWESRKGYKSWSFKEVA
jgi:glycosyltransferase involved in cell wall biosynthesis